MSTLAISASRECNRSSGACAVPAAASPVERAIDDIHAIGDKLVSKGGSFDDMNASLQKLAAKLDVGITLRGISTPNDPDRNVYQALVHDRQTNTDRPAGKFYVDNNTGKVTGAGYDSTELSR